MLLTFFNAFAIPSFPQVPQKEVLVLSCLAALVESQPTLTIAPLCNTAGLVVNVRFTLGYSIPQPVLLSFPVQDIVYGYLLFQCSLLVFSMTRDLYLW